MRRREFIAGLGSAAVWPGVVRAQQAERIRRIGVLMALDEADPEAKAQLSAFTQKLAELGWTDGRTIRMDIRWAAGNVERARIHAKELVDLRPDVIFADSTPEAVALQRETRTIPIIFVLVGDPVGAGLVAGLPRPGGNVTGFVPNEEGMAGKWLQLLTEIAPGVKRAAAMFNPETAPYIKSLYLPLFETAARLFKVMPITAPVDSDAEIETVINSLGHESGGGLVAMPGLYMNAHRATVISMAARNRVPVVYSSPQYAKDGGLISYGPDLEDLFRRAAPYVDRILRGAKPADLPVQLPVKFKMTVNAITAKTLGLAIPQSILSSADEVIE